MSRLRRRRGDSAPLAEVIVVVLYAVQVFIGLFSGFILVSVIRSLGRLA